MVSLALATLVFALGSGAMAIGFIVRQSVTPMTLIAGLSWGLLALQGRNIVRYLDGGGSVTLGSPAVQLLFALLSLLSFVAFLGSLEPLGFFPPDQQPEAESDYTR